VSNELRDQYGAFDFGKKHLWMVSKMKKTYFVMLMLLVSVGIYAQTIIPGGAITDTLWTLAGSPYQIEGDINIPTSHILKIRPGVEFLFNNNSQLTVNGVLKAEGTPRDSIYFGAYREEYYAMMWKGISFNNSSGSIIEYARITNVYASPAIAIINQSDNVQIRNSTIFENSARFPTGPEMGVGLQAIDSCNLKIENNLFVNNEYTIFTNDALYVIYVSDCYPVDFSNNVIRNNLVMRSMVFGTNQTIATNGTIKIYNNEIIYNDNSEDPVNIINHSENIFYEINKNNISHNQVHGYAFGESSGLYIAGRNMTIRENIISHNAGGTFGGG
jgi:hypothetical protein